MDLLEDFTIEELQELWQRKQRRAAIAQQDVKLRFQVQHLAQIVSARMINRDLRVELMALRDEAKGAVAADRRTERVSLAIHLTGLALVVGAMLWVAL